MYYTTNSGVAPGQPFTELTIDDNVFNSGQATALCVDKEDKVSTSADGRKTITDRAKLYGESNLALFIHASYEKDANMYFNKVYTANGSTRKAALLKLLELGCTEYLDMNLNEGVSKTDKDRDEKKVVGDFIYFGYRGYTLNQNAINEQPTAASKEEERRDQMKEAVYDIVCTIGKSYQPDGIVTDRYQIYYTPVVGPDSKGVDLNAGSNGPEIYMYYTTIWGTEQYNSKVGKDVSKYYSSSPEDYLKSPLTRLCFTRYDRVPYNKESAKKASNGDDKRAWEYVLYDDYSAPVDFNDGTVKLDSDFHTENNHITMFAQRENGSVKPKGEITGGYVSAKAEVGEMWLNR